jgi:hypothetical protein
MVDSNLLGSTEDFLITKKHFSEQSDDNSSHGLSYQMRKKQNILGPTRNLGLTNKSIFLNVLFCWIPFL